MASVDEQVDSSNDDTTCSVGFDYPAVAFIYFPHSTADYASFIRFPIDVPKGATVEDGCYVKVYIYSTRYTGIAQLQQTDEDDAADFSTSPWDRSVTGATVNWEVATGNQYDERQSPEIKTIIQDKIDRGDYDQGDHIAIRVSWITDGDNRVYQYDGDPTYAAKLHIEYSTGEGWSNIASLRQGTGEIASADIANIRMGTGSIAVADIAKISGVPV